MVQTVLGHDQADTHHFTTTDHYDNLISCASLLLNAVNHGFLDPGQPLLRFSSQIKGTREFFSLACGREKVLSNIYLLKVVASIISEYK